MVINFRKNTINLRYLAPSKSGSGQKNIQYDFLTPRNKLNFSPQLKSFIRQIFFKNIQDKSERVTKNALKS
jgi:hypothetical protein